MYKVVLLVRQLLSVYTHFMWKWIIRRLTGRCELLRIQYDAEPGTSRTTQTELSLRHSKCTECRALVEQSDEGTDLKEQVASVMDAKKILHDKHPVFRPRFTECAEKIVGFARLVQDLDTLRSEKYDEAQHGAELLDLWATLKPDDALEQRFTRQWGDIGFQGTDPASDFRGMGLLGFYNLIYFSKQHTALARHTLVQSVHPKYGYSFAIVGINLTELCLRFMKNGCLKAHFYNMEGTTPALDDFHQVYCYVFVEFNKLWMKEKPNIMQFNEIRDKYEKQLRRQLDSSRALLQLESCPSELVTQDY
ncbi:ELMO domain-containing protein 1-like [Watersipora subatra]|uniref:ELMO domain-containing protein 1-like n=1 Tax=Watersipora subatra TaxID=2589382 RepID=UPI00355C63AA